MSTVSASNLRHSRIDGLDMAWRFDEVPGAPVVLMAHGLLADHSLYDALSARLAPRFSVLRYDLRGHGRSGVSAGPYSMERLAQDAVDLLDTLGLARVHFIGTSLGGMLGQQLGARHGDRLLSLTLANTGAVQPAPAAWDERIALARARGTTEVLADGTLARWFTPAFAQQSPVELQRVREVLCRTPLQGFAAGAAAVRDLAQLALLPAIRVPTLVVAGAQDQATPPAQSQQLQAHIPDARLVMLDVAHQAAVEQPQAFEEAWSVFFGELATTSPRAKVAA